MLLNVCLVTYIIPHSYGPLYFTLFYNSPAFSSTRRLYLQPGQPFLKKIIICSRSVHDSTRNPVSYFLPCSSILFQTRPSADSDFPDERMNRPGNSSRWPGGCGKKTAAIGILQITAADSYEWLVMGHRVLAFDEFDFAYQLIKYFLELDIALYAFLIGLNQRFREFFILVVGFGIFLG